MSVRRTAADASILGDEIYQRDIRQQVEDAYYGKIVAIDVNSGDYAIGDTVSRCVEAPAETIAGRGCLERPSWISDITQLRGTAIAEG